MRPIEPIKVIISCVILCTNLPFTGCNAAIQQFEKVETEYICEGGSLYVNCTAGSGEVRGSSDGYVDYMWGPLS